ncbi:F-box only protein 15 [Salminus brasiliensis]|uniref:F-box only protein 15 n=1 Tax=Salminus brasiliensis TaxID=930266 RepID=UPI003B834538
MAAGRGQFFLSLMQGLQQVRPGGCADPGKKPDLTHPAGARVKTSLTPLHLSGRAVMCENPKPSLLPRPRPPLLPLPPPSLPPPSTSLCAYTPSVPYSHENYIDRLPPEIVLKILSYLDADSLFCISFVNRQLHKLANDNAIWYELYVNEIANKKWRPRLAILSDDTSSVQDVPPGFWKRLIFRELGCPKDTIWRKELGHINPYTGMPAQVKQILGGQRVNWEITLSLRGGQELVFKQDHTFFSDSSVTVCWNSGLWPRVRQVSTLQLHGVIRPFKGAATNKPQWRSLISKTVVSRQEKWKFLATDKLVKLLHFDEGITVGVWRGTWIIAFVMANLHFHKLVERSLLGSPSCPYRPSEVSPLYHGVSDPDCGLRGYTVFIVLHNSVRRIMRRRYFPVLGLTDNIGKGFVHFRPKYEHTPVLGRISFPWTAEGLQGEIKNCCMMTLTMLDEDQRPFWCVSSTVILLLSNSNHEQFVLPYSDVEGRVRMNFVWMPDMQQYFLIGLQIRVSVEKLNKHFGKEFFSPLGH